MGLIPLENKIMQDTSKIGLTQRTEVMTTSGQTFQKERNPYVFWNPSIQLYNPWSKRIANIMYSNVDIIDVLSETDKDGNKKEKAADVLHFLKLSRHLNRNNMIVWYNNSARTAFPATKEIIINQICGFNNEQAGRKFLSKIKKLGLVVEWKREDLDVSRYYINPIITMKYKGFSLECYALFKESIDEYLTDAAKQDLAKLYYMQGHPDITAEEVESIIKMNNGIITEQAAAAPSMDIFQRTVLDGKDVQYIYAPAWGTVHNIAPDNNENVFFLLQHSRNGKRTAADIDYYYNIAVDIDAGKDSAGNYVDLKTVEQRKADILAAIRPVIPTPTAIVSSRNGYHIYWTCEHTEIKESWLCTAQLVRNTLAGIIDGQVTTDAARVLRAPGSIHKKEGSDAYTVALKETNDIVYSYEELTAAFTAAAPDIKAVSSQLIKNIPDLASTAKTTRAQKSAEINTHEQTARIQAISALSLDTFTIPDIQRTMSTQQAKEFYKSQDLREFLQASGSICCINPEHDDEHPSATVYADRYVCHCILEESDGHGYDIINVVSMLADCSYTTAVKYLAKVYNVTINSKTAKMAV